MTTLPVLKNTDLTEQAMYHFYLVQAILKDKALTTSIGDVFGCGEDDFVMQMLEYANVYYVEFSAAFEAGNDFPGVVVYETPTLLAERFWARVDVDGEIYQNLPTIADFQIDVHTVLEFFLRPASGQWGE
jgi:hypothetical protein